MLSERMNEFGLSVRFLSKVEDDVDRICAIIDREIDGVDVFFSTGGVSVGRRDFMPTVIERLGARKLFWRVALKPGTPVLARLSGDSRIAYHRTHAVLNGGFDKESPGRRFVRAVYADGAVSVPVANHSPGALLSLPGCNALIDIPAGSGPLAPGARVEVVLL